MKKLKSYIDWWNKQESTKECNNNVFIQDFTEFAENSSVEHYEFTGDNCYCGCTAIISEFGKFEWVGGGLVFELAYGKDFVKVFTANHNGFWVPEYIDLKGEEARPLLDILKKKLIEWGGFDES